VHNRSTRQSRQHELKGLSARPPGSQGAISPANSHQRRCRRYRRFPHT